MLNRYFGSKFHDNFHLFGVCAFGVGLSTSKIILSVSMMLMLLNLFLEADFSKYIARLKSNRFFHLIILFFSLHLIGLLWTSDFGYAFSDIRIKLTFLVVPFILSAKPIIENKELKIIFWCFVSSLLVTSALNVLSYFQYLGNRTYVDIREMSLFGSHIRYGILIAMGVAACLYLMCRVQLILKTVLIILITWFGFYTYLSQVISGALSLFIVLFIYMIFNIFSVSKKIGYLTMVILIVSSLLFSGVLIRDLFSPKKHQLYPSKDLTVQGNHFSDNLVPESYVDGYPVHLNICEKELKTEWEKHSKIPFNGIDKKEQPIFYTLIRYMTSKKLDKDSLGFSQLSSYDINNIENGIASLEESKGGLIERWAGIKFQLTNHLNPNGHSLLQRLEYWKTGIEIIKKNGLIGVGTGDVQKAFDNEYILKKSPLSEKNRLRAHNSYLTSWISFGVTGFIFFLMIIGFFAVSHIRAKNFLPVAFIIVAAVTFFLEDTLETQTGVSFFAFFYGLFSLVTPTSDRHQSF